MPLDMTTIRLADVAGWHSVTPVPLEILEAHKRAEVNKHPGYRYYRLIPVVLNVAYLTVALGVIGFIPIFLSQAFDVEGDLLLALSVTFIICGTCALYFVSLGFSRLADNVQFYGPATWSEREISLEDLDAPKSIKLVARQIMQDDDGDMRLVLGELTQASVTLDPYLVIERNGERIILGIWDGDRIIRQAW